MKRIFLFLLILTGLTGCSVGQEKLETYLDNPETFIKDPHFAEYQANMDALESEYLAKKITYAEYIERKKELEDQYTKEVEERNEILSPNPYRDDLTQPNP